MNRWDAMLTLCGYLRAGLLRDQLSPPTENISWEVLVEVSSRHNVTPALAWCLKNKRDVPAEARDYFETILTLNRRRNETLFASLKRVVAVCNAIGIEPVPLKGAARLIERNYPSPSLRILSDLDVLIPAERSVDVVAALEAIGFRTNPGDEPMPPAHNHLPALYDGEDWACSVELHTHILKSQSAEIIETNWFWAGTQPSTFEDLRIRLPDATRSIGHVITHDQLHHRGYWNRRVELRQLLDVAMIRSRHESEIDWAELDDRFCHVEFEFGEVLATYLAIAEMLVGQPAPRLRREPRRDAIEDFRRLAGYEFESPRMFSGFTVPTQRKRSSSESNSGAAKLCDFLKGVRRAWLG